MKQTRLEALSDSIFGIVMTMLIFEIKVPLFVNMTPSGSEIFFGVVKLLPLFLSYTLSFVVLFTYWRAHHFIISSLAKNVDVKLTNINMLFFFFVGLIPFTSHMLGIYSTYPIAVIVFALNIIAIGYTLFWMRHHVIDSETIKNEKTTDEENRHAYTRILFPILLAIVAIVVSLYSTFYALLILTFGVLYNISTHSTEYTFAFLHYFYGMFRTKNSEAKQIVEEEGEIITETTIIRKRGRPKRILSNQISE